MTTMRVVAPDLSERELAYATDADRSGAVSSMGSYVEKFERAFGVFCEIPHVVSCISGTVALSLAMHRTGARAAWYRRCRHEAVFVPNESGP